MFRKPLRASIYLAAPRSRKAPKGQLAAEARRMRGVIAVFVAGFGMKKDRQTVTIEHQPGKQRRHEAAWKRDLIH